MVISSEARQRLAQRMEQQRTKLGLRWRQVTDTAGMTNEALRGIRKGPSQIPDFTRRAFERALQWPEGEIDRILEGTPEPEMTDDEILAMSGLEVARYILDLSDTDREAALTWGERAYRVILAAENKDTLASDIGEGNVKSDA